MNNWINEAVTNLTAPAKMSKSLRTIMDGVSYAMPPKAPEPPKIISPHTAQYYRPDGSRVIRLYRTDILVFMPPTKFIPYPRLQINYAPWPSNTTFTRINDALRVHNLHAFYRDRGADSGQAWIASGKNWDEYQTTERPFESGLILEGARTGGGGVGNGGYTFTLPKLSIDPSLDRKINRAINQYLKVCEVLDFNIPKHEGTVLLTRHYARDQLFGYHHIYGSQVTSPDNALTVASYKDHSLFYAIFWDAISKDPKALASLVAHKMDSKEAKARIRKAVRNYLENLLGKGAGK